MATIVKRVVLVTVLTLAFASVVAAQRSHSSRYKLSQKNVDEIAFSVTVTDKGGEFVKSLDAEDFGVSIDNKPARVISSSNTDSPISIGILVDSSGSIGRDLNKKDSKDFLALREAVRHFLESSNKANEYFLVGFSTKPQLMADWTSDPSVVMDRFNDLILYGSTALYDTCYVAVDKLQSGRHSKRALLLVSDGQDNYSRYTFNELKERLRESDALLYSISLADDLSFGSSLGDEARAVLVELSVPSGGKIFASKDGGKLRLKDLKPVFESIATELRNQYRLSVAAAGPLSAKKWHKIKVKVNRSPGVRRDVKGLTVRVREGFYVH
jgi:Ca-activated chloride channel family protein